MNILLLTVDSLRVDRTSLFDHSRDTTPCLAEIANAGFEFRRAYANGRNTAASFPAIQTSTHQRYIEGIGLPEEGTPTLAEFLGEHGYRTHAIHTNELISQDYNYGRGFDIYQDSRSAGETEGAVSWRNYVGNIIGDGILFDLVKKAHFLSTQHLGVKIFDTADATSGFEDHISRWVNETEDDWFIWAHYMNAHHPYEPPADCQKALGLTPVSRRQATKLSRKMRLRPEDISDDEAQTLRNLYDATVLSLDREIESVISRLQAAGELDETLVIITADHGELLGENGMFGHPPVLNQLLVRVPLIFKGGPVESGESNTQVELLDIAPTIFSILDEDIPNSYQGRPLFQADGSPMSYGPHPLISETGASGGDDLICAIDHDRKVVYAPDSDDWWSYRLSTDAISEKRSDEPFRDLRETVLEHLETAKANKTAGAGVETDDLREDLAALGYLDE